MRKSIVFWTTILLTPFVFSATEVKGISYDDTHATSIGDLYLPDVVTVDTPIALVIHGGAWNGGSKNDMVGVARFFQRELCMAAFNIDYRLAGADNRWPACGDDCIAAARFLLSEEFKRRHGFSYRKLLIFGASAGGHLALWTLVNLPTNQVSGCISVSSVADPVVCYQAFPSYFVPLFDTVTASALASMDPCSRVKTGMAPLLCTHALDDTVVPYASHKAIKTAYDAAGNDCVFCEYASTSFSPTPEAGHYIWRPSSSPHKLIAPIEQQIRKFVTRVANGGRLIPRALSVDSVGYSSSGELAKARLAFGAGNGMTNRLSVAWGSRDGGEVATSWEHVIDLCDVADDVTSLDVEIPADARFARFFLDVLFSGGERGTLLKSVKGNGSSKIDTGFRLQGGDAVRARICPSGKNASVLGSRTDVNNGDILLAFAGSAFVLDYCGKGSGTTYASYRHVPSCTVGTWYDVELSAERRCATVVGGSGSTNATACTHVFSTPGNCYLFGASGNPSLAQAFEGEVASFSVVRGDVCIADYVPYSVNGAYGFVDRATGKFMSGVGFSGVADLGTSSPFTAVSGLVTDGRIGRAVTVAAMTPSRIDLAFGPDNGQTNRLYMAWGKKDGGCSTNGWEHVDCLGEVVDGIASWRASVPQEALCMRFFLLSPCGADDVKLAYVTGDGLHAIDTGLILKGGDEVRTLFCPTTSATAAVLGSRQDAHHKDIRLALLGNDGKNNGYVVLDYCGDGNCNDFRLAPSGATGWFVNQWMDALLAPAIRSVTLHASGKGPTQTTLCDHVFETPDSCWLFGASGNCPEGKFSGRIASFSVTRGNGMAADYIPYRRGSSFGFFDRVSGIFRGEVGLQGLVDEANGESMTTYSSVVFPKSDAEPGRSVSVIARTGSTVDLGFGPDNGFVNRLYMAWGDHDCGLTTNDWAHVDFLGEVSGDDSVWHAEIPADAACLRFFMISPVISDDAPLSFVTGDGQHAFDTGIALHGGDEIRVLFCPTNIESSSILGSREGPNTGNILLAVSERDPANRNYEYVVADYCGQGSGDDFLRYRRHAEGGRGWYVNKWFEAVLSPTYRALTYADRREPGTTNAVVCTHSFVTAESCFLFGASGNPAAPQKFSGHIGAFTLTRNGEPVVDYVPYRRRTENGFFDRKSGCFLSAPWLAGSSSGMVSSELMTVSDVTWAKDSPVGVKFVFSKDENLQDVTWMTNGVVMSAIAGEAVDVPCGARLTVGATVGDWCQATGLGDYTVASAMDIPVTADKVSPMAIAASSKTVGEIKSDLQIRTAVFDGTDASMTKTNLARVVKWAEKNAVSPTAVNTAAFNVNGEPINQVATAYLLDVAPDGIAEALETARNALRIISFQCDDKGDWVVESAAGSNYGNGRIETWTSNSPSGPFAPGKVDELRRFARVHLVK